MFGLVSMHSIRRDFDAAMRKNGYVRVREKCEEWGVKPDAFQHLLRKGFECDSFIVNGVRYIAMWTALPDELKDKAQITKEDIQADETEEEAPENG